jgi:hypothetical protein
MAAGGVGADAVDYLAVEQPDDLLRLRFEAEAEQEPRNPAILHSKSAMSTGVR